MNKQVDIVNPFARLRVLLGDAQPGINPAIDMTIGSPKHAIPDFFKEVLAEKHGLYLDYPPIRAIPPLAGAIAEWHERRYGIGKKIDATSMILPLMGSREGLFSAVFTARDRKGKAMKGRGRQVALIPNPFYQVYAGGAQAAGLEAVYLAAPEESNFLPDLDKLCENNELLERTSVMFLCSPSNPQGAIASVAYLQKAIALARQYDFMLFSDECYSEIYYGEPPAGILQVAHAMGGGFSNVLAFNSLSKRSNLPGLRSGFVAGDPDFIDKYARFRNVSCPQMPLPVQFASAKLWADEAHVIENRALYAKKIDAAENILKPHISYEKPAGGFFLWIDMKELGGGEATVERIWKLCGVKMLPGAYLAHEGFGAQKGVNVAKNHVRIALVHDLETTREALKRIVSVF